MKKLIKNILLITALFFAASLSAQELPSAADSLVITNELPELEALLDSAMINSPLLRVSDRQIAQVLEQIKIEKKMWSDYFYLDANAKYGLYNELNLSSITTNPNNTVSVPAKNQQFNYYVGLTLKLPLSDLATKNNKLKILNENINEKQQHRDELKQQLQKMIIEAYYNLVFLSKSVKINQDILQSLSINLMKATKDIQSGLITMSVYNGMLVDKGKAEENFFKIKTLYYAQYKELILVTGCKF